MKPAAYQPREGSIAWRVIGFLTANPDESLTADDAGIKFECSSSAVHTSLGPAVLAGVLTRTEDPGSGELVYRRGNGAPARDAKPAPDAVGVALTAPLPHRRGDSYVDTAAIEIDKGVPLVSKCGGQQTDWAGLLQRMEPGDSCALPLRVRSSLSKVIHVEHVARPRRYQIRKVDGQTLRLWRTQ